MATFRMAVFYQMSSQIQNEKKSVTKRTRTKPPVTMPFEQGFHFYTGIGAYTGETAINLKEFAAKLQIVPTEAITFHFQRKDFQQWIIDIVKNASLAKRMNKIKQGLCPDDLRKEILNIVNAYKV